MAKEEEKEEVESSSLGKNYTNSNKVEDVEMEGK